MIPFPNHQIVYPRMQTFQCARLANDFTTLTAQIEFKNIVIAAWRPISLLYNAWNTQHRTVDHWGMQTSNFLRQIDKKMHSILSLLHSYRNRRINRLAAGFHPTEKRTISTCARHVIGTFHISHIRTIRALSVYIARRIYRLKRIALTATLRRIRPHVMLPSQILLKATRMFGIQSKSVPAHSRHYRLRRKQIVQPTFIATGYHRTSSHISRMWVMVWRRTIRNGMRLYGTTYRIVYERAALRPVLKHYGRRKNIVIDQIRTMTNFNHQITYVACKNVARKTRALRLPIKP